MVKRIPQPIKDKILLHNSDLSEDDKRVLRDFGAIFIDCYESILTNIPDLSDEEVAIIRKYTFPHNIRMIRETKDMTPESQAVIDRLVAKIFEIPEPENPPKKESDINE